MYTHEHNVRKSNTYLSSSYCFCILEHHLCCCDGTCSKIFCKLFEDADQTEHLDSSEQPAGQQQGHISSHWNCAVSQRVAVNSFSNFYKMYSSVVESKTNYIFWWTWQNVNVCVKAGEVEKGDTKVQTWVHKTALTVESSDSQLLFKCSLRCSKIYVCFSLCLQDQVFAWRTLETPQNYPQ